jgi:pimeloyl-ACP methyl ester carboxylesterase
MSPALPELPGVRHRYLPLSTRVRVHLAEAGPADAPAVLCLHGWPQHWLIWRRLIEHLQDECRLLCPDLRGMGWSGWPADGDFRKDRLAEDALALLDRLGIERAHVIGHDWGAFTGLLLAVRAPERLHSLLALGIVHPWQPRARMAANLWRFTYQLPVAAPGLGEALLRQESLTRRVLRAGWGDRDTWDEQAAASYAAVQAQQQAARAASRLYRTFVTREALPSVIGAFAGRRLGVPARLVVGREDPLDAGFAEGFERHGDDAQAEILEGCGHFVPEERPARVAEHARALIALVAPTTPAR